MWWENKKNRVKDFDYTQIGYYFVTVCIKSDHVVSSVQDTGKICLNALGVIIEEQLLWLEKRYPYAKIDVYAIMPNHVHFVVAIIRNPSLDMDVRNESKDFVVGASRDLHSTKVGSLSPQHEVEMHLRNPSPDMDVRIQNPKIKTLSELVGAFKTTSSKKIHLAGFVDLAWQHSFYEHIIRNDIDLQRIRQYILNNPIVWLEKHSKKQ